MKKKTSLTCFCETCRRVVITDAWEICWHSIYCVTGCGHRVCTPHPSVLTLYWQDPYVLQVRNRQAVVNAGVVSRRDITGPLVLWEHNKLFDTIPSVFSLQVYPFCVSRYKHVVHEMDLCEKKINSVFLLQRFLHVYWLKRVDQMYFF